jgi:hypothetical protein
LSLKIKVIGVFGLGIKIDSSGLVIWVSKSPRRFLGLSLKTKRILVCRLRHKTDGVRLTQDTHRDLAACFTWKQAGLWFLNLVSKLVDAQLHAVHVTSS